jgi:replicative DNA helicase
MGAKYADPWKNKVGVLVVSVAFDRVPPQNIDAEQALLGALILDREAIFSVMEHVGTGDFYKEAHRIIYDCLLSLNNRNEPVDLVTLVEELRRRNDLDKVGGISYVASLANVVPTAANAVYYAKIVAEKALLRSLISISTKIAQHGYEQNMEPWELIDEAEKMIFSVTQRKARDGFTLIKDVVVDTFEQIGQIKAQDGVTGLPTFKNLDYYLSGQPCCRFVGSMPRSRQYLALFLPMVTLRQTQGTRVIDWTKSTILSASSRGTICPKWTFFIHQVPIFRTKR